MKKLQILTFYLLFISKSMVLFSQEESVGLNTVSNILEREIIKMDSLLFTVAFNTCNMEVYKTMITEDIEFYDDRSGLNTSVAVEYASFKDKCAKPFLVTRKLVAHTIHVLGNYGALQKGMHDFYVDSKKVQTSKFITIWERKGGSWIVKRAISYDHKEM